MSSCWSRVGPQSNMIDVLTKRKNLDMQKHAQRKTPHENWSYVANKSRKLGEEPGADHSLETWEGARPCQHLGLRSWPLRTVSQYTPDVEAALCVVHFMATPANEYILAAHSASFFSPDPSIGDGDLLPPRNHCLWGLLTLLLFKIEGPLLHPLY